MGALTYNPSEDGIVLAKPVGALYYAVDARSTYYDSDYFVRRQFQSLAFVKTYFANPEFRKGWFTIYVNETGTLNTSTGLIDGGTTKEYWWRDNLTDGGLVEKKSDLTDYATLVYVNEQIEIVQEQVDELTDDLIQEIEDRQTGDEINADAIEATNAVVATKANSADIMSNFKITYADLDVATHTLYTNISLAGKTVDVETIVAGSFGTILTDQTFDEDGVLDLSALFPDASFLAKIDGVTGVLGDFIEKDYLLAGTNQYDYKKDITGYYIATTTGVLTISPTSSVSEKIPISEGEVVYLFDRTGNGGFRFLNNVDTPLKPLKIDGTEFISYADFLNGGFKAPAAAVSYQFTTNFVGTTNKTNILASSVDDGQPYIKDEFLGSPLLVELREDVDFVSQEVIAIQGPPATPRINKNEDSILPQAFPPIEEQTNAFAIEIVEDTDSPTHEFIRYKRVFSNTTVPDDGTCNRTFAVPIGVLRPTVMSFGFWVKKTEFEDIYNTQFQSFLGARAYVVNPQLVLNGFPQSVSPGGSSIPEYTSATMTMTKIAEEGDFIRLRLTYSNITWKGDFVGTAITYYYLFNGADFFEKSMDFIDFTVLFDEEILSNIIYPDPEGAFGSNLITLQSLKSEDEDLDQRVSELEIKVAGECVVTIRNTKDLYFSTPFNDERNLVKRLDVLRPNSFTDNPNITFINEFLADKDGAQNINVLNLKNSSDDICPAFVNGSYIGANHGWNQPANIPKTAHGKTISDVGNIYTATGKQYVIMRIVDANNFWVCARNEAVDGFTYTFSLPVGDLVYTSGDGANQGTISGYTAVSIGNLYGGSISVSEKKILLNGVTEISGNGDYSCDFLDILDTYDVFDLPSIVQKMIDNRPVGGYLTQPYFNELGADKLINFSIAYRLTADGNTLISHNFRAYKKLKFTFQGFIQANPLDSGSLVIPKTLPISDGVKTWDFRKIENYVSAPASTLNFTIPYWEKALSPPDRFINLNDDVVFHCGYVIDRGIEASRKDVVNNSIWLFTSRKIYPMGVYPTSTATLDANTFYTAVCFRQFTNADNNPSARTNFSHFEVGEDIFVYLDYHNSIDDYLDVPQNWIGKKIEVIESTANVIVLSSVVTSKLNVLSTVAPDSYGYAYLKITS